MFAHKEERREKEEGVYQVKSRAGCLCASKFNMRQVVHLPGIQQHLVSDGQRRQCIVIASKRPQALHNRQPARPPHMAGYSWPRAHFNIFLAVRASWPVIRWRITIPINGPKTAEKETTIINTQHPTRTLGHGVRTHGDHGWMNITQRHVDAAPFQCVHFSCTII